MNAKIVKATTMERVKLGEVLPLDTPFTIQIFPTNSCNFKCIYCAHSNSDIKYESCFMDFESYKKAIDDMKAFRQKIKVLMIAGIGEPLMHPRIADMVRYAKEKEVAETVRIITNASLLSPKLSDELISAGLDSLKISIQGLDDKKYYEMCGTTIPLKRIMDNIRYFYEHKTTTQVNIKIVSEAFETEADEQRFFDMFGSMCDIINVEHIADYQEDSVIEKRGKFISQTGTLGEPNKICQLPFYIFSLFPDGEIIACCRLMLEDYKSLSLGNIRDVNICEAWNSNKMNKFRLMHLREQKEKVSRCKDCEAAYQSICRKEDNLDLYKDRLIEIYEKIVEQC